jgi:excisionase family DNA binding protein
VRPAPDRARGDDRVSPSGSGSGRVELPVRRALPLEPHDADGETTPGVRSRPSKRVSDITFMAAGAHTVVVRPATLDRLTIPDDEMSASAAEAAARLASYLREHPVPPGPAGRVVLCVPDVPEVRVTVPIEAFRLFIDLLDRLSQGSAVTIARYDHELTTQQAAELLNVSRPYLVKLLERGEIPFRKVGSHRRVLLRDVLDYQRRDDARRDQILRELIRESEDLGLYED